MTDVGAKTWDSARCGVVVGGGGGGGDGGDVATCSFSTLAGNPCCSPLHHSGCQHPNIRRHGQGRKPAGCLQRHTQSVRRGIEFRHLF